MVKRPYIPEDAARRVEQFAVKENISSKEAYRRVVKLVLDEEANRREITA